MTTPTDTDLLNALERYRWDIDAPGEAGTTTWVVYDPDHPFDTGLASARSLRAALLRAYAITLKAKDSTPAT
jgi:hypothetical protein